jgi:hypothetical protein
MADSERKEEPEGRGGWAAGWPLVGALSAARSRDYQEAAAELIITLLISTIPIWFGSVIYIMAKSDAGSFSDVIGKNIGRGELFLMTSSLMAPILYFIFKGEDKFPHAMTINAICTLILIICTGAFGAIRLTSFFEINLTWNDKFIMWVSASTFVMGALIVYLAFVYRNLHEDGAANLMQRNVNDFWEKYKNNRQRREK